MNLSKYSIDGQAGRAQKLSHTQRFRIELARLENDLHQKQIEYEDACSVRQVLNSRIELLNSLASNSSQASQLQQIILRTFCLKNPISASSSTAMWDSSSMNAFPCGLSFDALPPSLKHYDESLLLRMTQMTPRDLGIVYKSFLIRYRKLKGRLC